MGRAKWARRLCCEVDCRSCAYATFCPLCYIGGVVGSVPAGRAALKDGRRVPFAGRPALASGALLIPGVLYYAVSTARCWAREQTGLSSDPASDYALAVCCAQCAACQTNAQIKLSLAEGHTFSAPRVQKMNL